MNLAYNHQLTPDFGKAKDMERFYIRNLLGKGHMEFKRLILE